MLNSPHREFFKTLGNQIRVEIILFLLEGEKNVTEIVERLNANQSSVSHNLKRLLTCSFISVRTNGKERVYSVNKKTIVPLFRIIEKHANAYCKKNCCK